MLFFDKYINTNNLIMFQKRILEAINEGIRKSLLSFDDIQFDQTEMSQKKISDNIHKYHPILSNFVDLGLPSGTLWGKCNIGATCEEDNAKSWYGDYYAWAETSTKDKFTRDNYTYCKNRYQNERTIIPKKQDIATLTFGKYAHIPSKEQWEELLNYTEQDTCKYNNIKGLYGVVFTGRNGNELFIPFAGFKDDLGLIRYDDIMYLWTQNSEPWGYAYNFFYTMDNYGITHNDKYDGFSIRPVANMK